MSDTAEWAINSDGWYPYCTSCLYEPDKEIREKGLKLYELPFCPCCGAVMNINYWAEYYKNNQK